MPTTTTPTPPGTLRIIRYAMFTGMVGFAAVAWYLSQQPERTAAENLPMFRIVSYVLCAVALMGIFVLKGVRAKAEPAQRTTVALIASALAEGAGFMGCVFILQGGEVAPFVLALVIFLASWTLLPADPDEL